MEERKLRVFRLENDRELQHAVLSVFRASTHSVKIVENHTDCAFIRQRFVQPLAAVQPGIAQAAPNGPAPTQNPGLLR